MNPDLQAKLAQLASQRGRDTEALVVEAVERMVNYDDWFIGEVEEGIAAADRGEFIEHGEVGKRINQRYPGNADPLDGARRGALPLNLRF